MGRASHKCYVYAKDKRLGHAIFGLMEATMNSTSSRSAKKGCLEMLASDLPCLTCSNYSFSNSAFGSTDILMPIYLAFLQALEPSRPLCPRKLRQASIQPVRALLLAERTVDGVHAQLISTLIRIWDVKERLCDSKYVKAA